MRAVNRADLARLLTAAGWDRATMTSRSEPSVERLLIRELDSPPFQGGAHRPLRLPEEDQVIKISVADRPALSGLVPALLREAGADSVIAAVPLGAYWLNNRGLAAYLRRVPDALRVNSLLRQVGLTDRFQGGFLISSPEFETHASILASQPFCGGPDVYFAARPAPLLITACHEFDLHLESPDSELTQSLAALARRRGLDVRGLEEPGDEPEDIT